MMMLEQIEYLPELGVEKARVVALLHAVGDAVASGDALILVESDKAQIEVPAAHSGVLEAWLCAVGDEISGGAAVCRMRSSLAAEAVPDEVPADTREVVTPAAPHRPSGVYAGPGVRRLARLLGVSLEHCRGSGPKGRITRDDVHQHAQHQKEVVYTLTGRQRASGAHLMRSWQSIPHVTHASYADVTDLEHVRRTLKERHQLKISLLPCVVRAVALALKEMPKCGGRLSDDGSRILPAPLPGINIAVHAEEGLAVPRLEGCDVLSFRDLCLALDALVLKVRSGQAQEHNAPGAITISSLGSVGGVWFTPIINAPQIAIVGVMRAEWRPIWHAHSWLPRYHVPIVLSYDHRAMDGFEAQLFLNAIQKHLESMAQDPWLVWSNV